MGSDLCCFVSAALTLPIGLVRSDLCCFVSAALTLPIGLCVNLSFC